MKQMKVILFFSAMFFLTFSALAQTKGNVIAGKVTNTARQGIEAATVSLYRAKDSVLAKSAISDAQGEFELVGIIQGKYYLTISAAGMAAYKSDFIEITDEKAPAPLGTIVLKESVKELDAVSVSAKKPFIEQKIDKMVVNVDAAVTNVGATALEVLEKSPGVTVDKDGAIALKGKQQVLVMMDGRPTYLGPNELANLLRSMPATSIETIEIMTNPSAKYDAAGNSGVINIRTKKNKQRGFNGSVTLNYGQGKYWKTNNSFNLNYRTGKFNFFANGGYSKWNGFQNLDINRKFKNPATGDITAIFESETRMRNISDNYTLKLGTDYYLSKKTTIGFVVSGFYNPEQFSSLSTSFLQNANAVTDSIVYAESANNNKWKNGTANLNLRHQFDSTGKELTADLDYVSYNSQSKQNFTNSTFDQNWGKLHEEVLRGDLPVNINIYSGKVDYSQPIGKEMKLETGVKSSYVETDNSALYYNLIDNGESVDLSKTNKFSYKENINAVYVNFNKQFKKLGVQAGLRYEHTNIKGLQYGNPVNADSSFSRSYGSLFPSVFLSYKASKNHQWGLNYGRRIDRPAYQDLNPFLFFLDNYTYQSGNPFMRPQFTNNGELSHTYKGFLTTTLNYSYTTDFQTETFEQAKLSTGEESYATIVRQGNIGVRHNAGVAVSAQVPVKKWWMAILYTNVNYSKFSGEINGEMLNVEATNFLVNINNQFKFEKGWSAELSGWYRSRGIEGQIVIQPLSQVSLGVTKQVLKGKGTVKFNVRDVFYTQKVKGEINFENTMAKFYNVRDSRVANISFVYRFGKPIKDAKPRKQSGGADDEQNRIKRNSGN